MIRMPRVGRHGNVAMARLAKEINVWDRPRFVGKSTVRAPKPIIKAAMSSGSKMDFSEFQLDRHATSLYLVSFAKRNRPYVIAVRAKPSRDPGRRFEAAEKRVSLFHLRMFKTDDYRQVEAVKIGEFSNAFQASRFASAFDMARKVGDSAVGAGVTLAVGSGLLALLSQIPLGGIIASLTGGALNSPF